MSTRNVGYNKLREEKLMDEFLENCSDDKLEELYKQISQGEKSSFISDQPLRKFIDETWAGIFVMQYKTYKEITKRHYGGSK